MWPVIELNLAFQTWLFSVSYRKEIDLVDVKIGLLAIYLLTYINPRTGYALAGGRRLIDCFCVQCCRNCLEMCLKGWELWG